MEGVQKKMLTTLLVFLPLTLCTQYFYLSGKMVIINNKIFVIFQKTEDPGRNDKAFGHSPVHTSSVTRLLAESD